MLLKEFEDYRLGLVKNMALAFLACHYPAKYTIRSIARRLFHNPTDVEVALSYLRTDGLVEMTADRVDVYFGATTKGQSIMDAEVK